MKTNNLLKKQEEEFHFMLSKFSHEIRNPLALINSELQVIADNYPEVTKHPYWNDLMDNLEFTGALLNNLSDYNNAGKLSLQSVDLKEYLDTVLASAASICQYLQIQLEAHVDSNLPVFSIDPVKLRQALLNLLRNAWESISHPDGKIIFHAFATSEKICITIQDNGCGIPVEHLQHIFTPFVTYKQNGNGLGLAITRQIILAHNGQIQVHSTPKAGTTFQIFLDRTYLG